MKLNFKSVPLTGVELKFDEGGRRFKGYASTFNGNDSYGDTILPGAYQKTIAENMPKMFWGHDWDIPIGKWLSAVEDEKGLLVEGEFTPGNAQAEAVMSAMKHGTVDGLSIGFRLAEGDYESKKDGGRIIKKHLLTNCMGTLIVTTTLQIPSSIFTESYLSFLGLGVAAPMPSLGSLATDAVKGMNTYPVLLIAPALMISVMILVFNLFGDGLRDAFDPKLKS